MMDDFDYQEDIEIMRIVKQHLEIIENPQQDFVYISKLVKNYLKTHCRHIIVKDVIDISPETSKTIHYCSKCMHTFS
jgi:predicted metal-dependent RNase